MTLKRMCCSTLSLSMIGLGGMFWKKCRDHFVVVGSMFTTVSGPSRTLESGAVQCEPWPTLRMPPIKSRAKDSSEVPGR